ncbi:DUF559 domain-containing protein [Micropruina sp.]|uniref:DUF559 domain-containing protein n=1 Tax=Micropruina sp. TaxID=2737536 RepID=UPI0039E2AD94
MERVLELLQAEGGVLVRRQHPTITRQLDHCLATGRLVPVLPGIYSAPEPGWQVKIRAAAAFRPGGVISGAAAARITWWPECPITSVTVAVSREVRGSYPGFVWERRRVAAELIVDRGELRIAGPSQSVLDLIPALGGTVIDQALRLRAVRLVELWQALETDSHRSGNAHRRALLRDSRDEPWSEPERTAHRLLRSAGVTGWRTNHRIVVGETTYYGDIVFDAARVVVEVDGYEWHSGRVEFTRDRWRYARLSAAGWTVLPVAADAIDDDPQGFVELVRTALSLTGRGPRV